MGRIRKTNNTGISKIVWKIALYVRLSKEDGNDISISVDNQLKELNTYVEQFEDEFEIVDTYIDDGYTGTDSLRDSFQRMLNDIRDKKVNCVIVRDPSRLSRNYLEAGMYMEQFFVQYNIRFISLSLPKLDSYKNPETMNSISVPIQNVINDDFCRQTSQKIRGVFNMKRSRGEFIGAFAPYGYSKSSLDKNKLVIDPEAAENIRNIYKWFVYDGKSKVSITKRLNTLNILNPTAYKKSKGLKYNCREANHDDLWNTRTVDFILTNEVYIGNMVQGRQRIKSYKVHEAIHTPKEEWFIVEGTHEAIIDIDTFNKAQELKLRDTRISPVKGELSLFAGLIKCADCNKAMRKTSAKSKTYYVCRTNRDKSSTACSPHGIREDVLEEVVLKVIKYQISLIRDFNDIYSKVNATIELVNKSDRLEKLLAIKQNELLKNKSLLDSMYVDWKMNDISKEQYDRIKLKVEDTISRLNESIDILLDEIVNNKSEQRDNNPLYDNFVLNSNVLSLDRSILISLIDTIYIHEDKHITIKFNYIDPYKLIFSDD